jgi:hypothetical protein
MSMTDYIHECECGRQYRVWAVRVPYRDKDDISCKCGLMIKAWNEGKIWHAESLKPAPKPRIKRVTT